MSGVVISCGGGGVVVTLQTTSFSAKTESCLSDSSLEQLALREDHSQSVGIQELAAERLPLRSMGRYVILLVLQSDADAKGLLTTAFKYVETFKVFQPFTGRPRDFELGTLKPQALYLVGLVSENPCGCYVQSNS